MSHLSTSSSSHGRVVVVGASLAGLRAAEALRGAGHTGELVIVGMEGHTPYDRPPLSKAVLTGRTEPSETPLRIPDNLRARWLLGHRAVAVDFTDRRLHLDNGTNLKFDGLVIATGASPRTLANGTKRSPRGVHTLRTLDDSADLRRALTEHPRRVAVVGAGFIGTEVAASVRALGLGVTLVDGASLPLVTAMGEAVGRHCARLHERHGVDLRMGVPVQTLVSVDGVLHGVELVDGTEVPADLAVLGLGTVPNTTWLAGTGALLDDGVRTDASLRVLDTRGRAIFGTVAAGDIVRWPHPLFDHELVRVEHWSNAADQARVAAATLLSDLSGRAGDCAAPYAGVPSFWSDQYEVKLLSVGLPHLADYTALLDGRPEEDRFVIGYGRNGRMVGAVGVNHPRRLARYRRHIAARGVWPPPVG